MYPLYEVNYQFWHIFYALSLLMTMTIGSLAILADMRRNGVKIGFYKPYWLTTPLMLSAAAGGLLLLPPGVAIIITVHCALLFLAPLGAFLIATTLFVMTYFTSIYVMFVGFRPTI